MNKITFQDHFDLPDGCCDDYGTRVRVNGKIILEYADMNPYDLELILKELEVDFQIEFLDDED
jgi:hypothetical protein